MRTGTFFWTAGKSAAVGLAIAVTWLLLDAAWFAVTGNPDVLSNPIDTFGAGAAGAWAVYVLRDSP